MAARAESTRLSRMNGYASNRLCPTRIQVLTAIQASNTPLKMKMNGQLPPNRATRSATRWPSVIWASNSWFTSLLTRPRRATFVTSDCSMSEILRYSASR